MLKYLLLLAILPMILISYSFAELSNEITVTTDKTFYNADEIITVSGFVKTLADYEQAVTIMIISPEKNLMHIGLALPQPDGNYSHTFKAHYDMSIGIEGYEVRVQYGDNYRSTNNIIIESITITTNQQSYHIGESILVSGQLTNPHNGTSISIMLELPNGALSPVHNITRNSTNHFNTTILTGNNTSISTHGIYSLSAHYNNSTANTTFDYATLQEEELYHNSSYLTLSDHEIAKWNNTLQQWQHAQNVTDNQTELYYEKLDRAISRNQTNQIELFTDRIGHSLALSSLYDGIIECLQEQLDLLS